jgi:hypothetical protein
LDEKIQLDNYIQYMGNIHFGSVHHEEITVLEGVHHFVTLVTLKSE